MKRLLQFTLAMALFGLACCRTQADFTSFHVFGDSLSTTASNTVAFPASTNYYGRRFSNGRVWVEVLAQQQGLAFNSSNNPHAFFGNTSSNLFAQTAAYTPPADASNALVVIWVNNADLYYPALDATPTLAKFTNAINLALTNQFRAITNLYFKGIRTLVMPNVVDISTVPLFNAYAAQTNLFHQAAINYNAAFIATVDQVRTNPSYAGLTIHVPDFFTLLTNLLAHPIQYGVTNALSGGLSIDALDSLSNRSISNSPGTNYIFWDDTNPTAKVHSWMASLAQQIISPVQIGGITTLVGSNRLDLVNVPVGQNGIVIGSGDLASGNWTTNLVFNSTNTAQSILVPASWPQWFYQLKFPVVWTWP